MGSTDSGRGLEDRGTASKDGGRPLKAAGRALKATFGALSVGFKALLERFRALPPPCKGRRHQEERGRILKRTLRNGPRKLLFNLSTISF